jgi:hypothetical protein
MKNAFQCRVAMVLILAVNPWLSGCGQHKGQSEFPLRQGRTVNDIDIREKGTYAIALRYAFDSPASREVAWRLAHDKAGCAPCDIRLRIMAPDKRILFDGRVDAPPLTSWGEGFLDAELARMPLAPGRYSIEATSSSTFLAPGTARPTAPMSIVVAPAYVGK